jgi:hypothetical protein
MTDEKIEALKAAALAATPQNIDSAESIDRFEDGSHIECPACSGEGYVPREADFCNYDGTAIGVQFYGIGAAHGAAEAYFRAVSPANVLALIGRLECAEVALLSARKPAAPQSFETWATKEGLISESHGVRFVNSMCDVARKAWSAALAALAAAPAQSGEPVAIVRDNPDDIGTIIEATCPLEVGTQLYLAAPQPAQTAQSGEACKCRRLGDWDGRNHHPLCDEAPAQSAVVLDDERAAFEAWWKSNGCIAIGKTWTEDACCMAWQARAASPQPVAQTERALTEPAYSWLTISSAPRDGSNILIRFGRDGASQAKYVPGVPHPWKFIDTNDGITWLINGARDDEYGPSHWMPMPSVHEAEPGHVTAAQPASGGDHE